MRMRTVGTQPTKQRCPTMSETTCVHQPQEPPGYDLAKQHRSVWCDVCHRAIWYEDSMSDVVVGQTYISAPRHMDDDGRLMVVVAVAGDSVTLDCAFRVSSHGELHQQGARRMTTSVARLANPRFWRRGAA